MGRSAHAIQPGALYINGGTMSNIVPIDDPKFTAALCAVFSEQVFAGRWVKHRPANVELTEKALAYLAELPTPARDGQPVSDFL